MTQKHDIDLKALIACCATLECAHEYDDRATAEEWLRKHDLTLEKGIAILQEAGVIKP